MPTVASIEPRRHGNKFVVSLPPALSDTGKRKRHSFDTQKEAQQFADSFKKDREVGLQIASRASTQLIRAAVDLDEELRYHYGFEGGLVEAVEELKRRLDAERVLPTFHTLLARFEKDRGVDWSEGSMGRQEWFRKQVADVNFAPHQLFLSDTWSEWLNARAEEQNWSEGTFNAAAGMLSSVFEHGIKKSLITFNPMRGVCRKKVRNGAPAVYTVSQTEALLNCAWNHDRELVPYFAIAVFAGLRPADKDSEISRLTWEDINWDERWIRVNATKTETVRYVNMEDNLLAWLKPFQGRTGSVVPVNLTRRRRDIIRGRYQSPKGTPASEWTALVPNGESYRDITRHTFGSYLDAKYRDYRVITEQMGHTDIKTYQSHYRNARTKKEGEQFWAIMPPVA